MKSRHHKYLAAAVVLSLITIAPPAFGQNPNKGTFEQSLRPIPRVLQIGHQGLPTVGSATRQEPHQSYSSASMLGTDANPRTAAGRPVPRSGPASAAPPGCPPPPGVSGKPAIGFKVAFEFNSAQLKPKSIDVLRELGKALNGSVLSDQKRFEIEGHTDAVGSLTYNEELSRQRAEAVKDFLVREMGVSAERLVVVGRGFCQLADPRNPRGAENRRVVVVNTAS
jgi:outer membrane protein OmpA-like peptidoglycan-associated protein